MGFMKVVSLIFDDYKTDVIDRAKTLKRLDALLDEYKE
jgi:hypothetical protein